MIELGENDFSAVIKCPWCNAQGGRIEYKSEYECHAIRCHSCGIVYADKVLNERGKKKYWEKYLSNVHEASDAAVQKRHKMYRVEYGFIKPMLKPSAAILDVGCGNGDFLKEFATAGFDVCGVEYGQEAAETAGKKFPVYLGELPSLDIKRKFDLIIFRGSIQYFPNPKEYLNKAISLLNHEGVIFVTSSPNSDSLCFDLFKEKFTIPVTIVEPLSFNKRVLCEYFENAGFSLINNQHFYLETPYANLKSDILRVANAIELQAKGKRPIDKSPAFYDNMLSLVFKKN